ncbi:hypothetical protein [Aeoliella sp. SH292]|uniref:hypothetical protein n=1 Tax=Aeoliella sp. SH292 TaxID=3454464 RepID=UPI003F96139D
MSPRAGTTARGRGRKVPADRLALVSRTRDLAEEVLALREFYNGQLVPSDYDYYTELHLKLSVLADLLALSRAEQVTQAKAFVAQHDAWIDVFRKKPTGGST